MDIRIIKDTLKAISMLKGKLKMNPTEKEVGEELGISQVAVYYRCVYLRDRGLVTFSNLHRSLRITPEQRSNIDIFLKEVKK